MKIDLAFLIFVILFLSACNSKEIRDSNKTSLQVEMPEGAYAIEYRHHIYINGFVDGVQGDFVFDTGADNLYLDSLFFNQNQFNYIQVGQALLPGAGTTPQQVKIILDTVDFHFGDNHYKTNIVPILSLKTILGDFADGIFGLHYFTDKILEINYKNEFIRIYSDIDSIDLNLYTAIPCKRIKNRLYVPSQIQINDSLEIEGLFTLDIGSGSAYVLTSPVAKLYNLDWNIQEKVKYYTKYGGVGGHSENYSFLAKSAKLGNFIFGKPITEYSLDTSGALASVKSYGLLGNEILDRFDVVIDFKSSILYLKPNDNFSTEFENPRLGFSYVDRSETYLVWIVRGLFKDSPAEKSGLQIDDRITHVNRKPVVEINYQDQQDIFKNLNELELTINRNGEVLTFEFLMVDIFDY